MKRTFNKRRTFLPPRGRCPVCKTGRALSWKNEESLESFVSDRGRILSRARTNLCAKHQRSLAREIKRARFLALLPSAMRSR